MYRDGETIELIMKLTDALDESMDALWHEFGSYNEEHAELIGWKPPAD